MNAAEVERSVQPKPLLSSFLRDVRGRMAASSAPTGAVVTDEALVRIIKCAIANVRNPHCNGGRGRTGVVSAVVTALYKGIENLMAKEKEAC